MRLVTLITLLTFISLAALPTKVKTVSGEYTFYGDGSHSPAECRRLALEGARLQALAKEFGTVVTQDVYQQETVTQSGESLYFSSLNATEVKGEWLGDDEEPVYETSIDDDGHIIVKCTVKGKARAISNEAADFDSRILRNGKEVRFADTRFRDGDDMYLYFKSPIDGYLAVYLLGEDRMAYRLLPYSEDAKGEVKVHHGKEYVFFDASQSYFPSIAVDEFSFTASQPVERNRVYVVFSPVKFSIRADSRQDAQLPPQLSGDEFSRWLTDSRRRDSKMGVKVMHIEINQ